MKYDLNHVAELCRQHNSPASAQGIEFLMKVVDAQERYIGYLIECDQLASGLLHSHNWKWPQALWKKGESIRNELAILEAEHLGTSPTIKNDPGPDGTPTLGEQMAVYPPPQPFYVSDTVMNPGLPEPLPVDTYTAQTYETPLPSDDDEAGIDVLAPLYHCHFGKIGTLNMAYRLAAEMSHKGLHGDIAEFGVAFGACVAAMKLAAPEKTVWAFDSFKGIPLAGRKDFQQPGDGAKLDPLRALPDDMLVSTGVTAVTRSEFLSKVAGVGLIESDFNIYEGWVESTLPALQGSSMAIQNLCILRLDLDLHDPTKLVLEHLWHRLAPGGALIVDDWGLAGVRNAVEEFLREEEYTPIWQGDPTAAYPVYLYK